MAGPGEATMIVLTGMMGSGKSSVGATLSERSGWPYLDNDELVRAATGREPGDIDATDGEAVLHVAEAAALHHALRLPPPLIIGAAAWIVADADSVQLLRDAAASGGPARAREVIYLRARPETLLARIGAGDGRRADATDLEWLRARFDERDEAYRALATLTIDTDELDVETVVERILGALAGRAAS